MQINSCKLILELVDEETGEIMTREATLGDFKEVRKPQLVLEHVNQKIQIL